MDSRVLVLGANGYLGLHVVDALRAEGVEPRCGRRRRSNVLGLLSRRAERVLADLDEPDTLGAAMAGVHTVVHVAGHYPRHSLDPVGSEALARRQAHAVVAAAEAAGVRRLVYVSSTATVAPRPDGGAATEADRWPAAPPHGLYHRLKWAMEEIVAAAHDMEVRVALPSGCIGPGDLRVGTSALVVALGRGMDPPHNDGVVSIVDPRDVAVGVARMAVRADAPARVILSGESRRLHALLTDAAPHLGVAPPSPPMSDAAFLELARRSEADARESGVRAGLSVEIAELAVHGVPLDASLAERSLGLRFRPFGESLADFVRWATPLGFFTPQPEPSP